MRTSFFVTISALALLVAAGGQARAEVIVLRSGQVGGLPGVAGQPDDTVRFLNNNPGGAPISASPFTPADYLGAATGAPAVVINPVSVWTPGISDPAARWINFGADIYTDTNGMQTGTGFGIPSGSSLYAVPFFVTTAGAVGGILNMEFAVDDGGGDTLWGGGNPAFLYINGVSTGYTGGNYGASTFHSQFIPFTAGWNTIYLYQRDQGLGVSGTIFSITIDVVAPTPGAAGVLALGGIVATRRRRA